ncbi:MAG: aminotransferase class III-fold pyridoxal phosphate-dependent enzyme [Syntrophomonadaceae bacterium]|nr:aminotransferase class III-fold pyridoxal phosphate-dependent enzyme [Syntrophomonadaceae bacterium]
MSDLRNDLLNPTLKETLSLFQLDKNYISGQGSYLLDEKGQRYLDFISQYGAVPFGYNPEFIWECLQEVREKCLPSLVQPSIPQEALKLANMLADCSPGDLCYCTFCQSGAEAVEAAIKLARSSTSRKIIVSTTNSFHGKTMGALSATGKESYQKPFYAPIPGFITVPYNDIAALEQVFAQQGNNIAAFIVEPVQGEGGIIVAQPGYLAAAREICSAYGAALILDEIQTGLGRTGRLFACEYENIEPDIMLLAKALGGGLLPLAVCISSPQIWNDDFGMLHSSTFANNNLTCSVGQAVLEKLLDDEQQLVQEVARKGDYLLEQLQQLAGRYPDAVKEVRGRGLMLGLEFHDLKDCGSYDTAFIINSGGFTALVTGFLLNVYHIRLAPFLNDSMTLRLEPALNISYEDMDHVVEVLDTVCKIVSYRDFAQFYRYILGDYSKPEQIIDHRHHSRKTKSSRLKAGEEASEKFAFIIHYPGPEDVVANNPSFASFNRDELYRFLDWQKGSPGVQIVCHMPAIRSLDGKIAEGWLIGVPFGAREMMDLPRQETVAMITEAVDLGKELGAGIVGLGALTSVVTRGGRSVQGQGVAITSGNSFTTLMAMEALFAGVEKMHINPDHSRAAVVGATGSIGRVCTLMLSEQSSQITLLGNPQRPNNGNQRLENLFSELFAYAYQRMQTGQLSGLSKWLKQSLDMLMARNSTRARESAQVLSEGIDLSPKSLSDICDYLGIELPLQVSLDIDSTLPLCDMIVAASNSPDYIIYPQHLKPGAVVCDVARPADVSPQVFKERDDVLILEGGLVQYPDKISFGPNMGYRDGVNLACLSETVLLALEGDYNDYSIGSHIPLETVNYLRSLGKKHGLGLAGLKMDNQEISDREIEAIYQRSLQCRERPLCRSVMG